MLANLPRVYSRRCLVCAELKPIDEFPSNGAPSHPSGVSAWKPRCQRCHEQWRLDHHLKKRLGDQ